MTRILLVCPGNICRSPMAEVVLRQMAEGRDIEVDSAGIGAFQADEPPWPKAMDAARARGYEMRDLRARRLRRDDFTKFDLILAMDQETRLELEGQRPLGNETPLRLFMDFVPDLASRQIPDPYYTGDFEGTLDLIEMGAHHLIRRLDRI